VFGHEHYAEHLEDLACAGVPIRHPISGKTVGAVDLTCWRKDADPLLIALAKTTADQITQALLTTAAREFELLQEYLRACRRTSGIVLALDNDVVMMNDYARQVLDPPPTRRLLLGQAAEALARRQPARWTVGAADRRQGPDVLPPRRPMTAGSRRHRAREADRARPHRARGAGPGAGAKTRMYLPGLVGSGPAVAARVPPGRTRATPRPSG
jgi:transcriptional regulator of acetoin/glycerol metabolism